MTKGTVVIFGATSSIAYSTAVNFAERGYNLFLASRDEKELKRLSSDLKVRHNVDVSYGVFDLESTEKHSALFRKILVSSHHNIAGVVMACGELGKQSNSQKDFREAYTIINRNFTGVCSILTHVANYLERRKEGFIIGITSVAGDRGRQSNYVYGAAKGGLDLFLQGLRNRLHSSNVRVLTVRPGFVDTAMTYGLPGLCLVASPKRVGDDIIKALDKGKDIVYTPWFWRYIMAIFKMLPETVFKRIKL